MNAKINLKLLPHIVITQNKQTKHTIYKQNILYTNKTRNQFPSITHNTQPMPFDHPRHATLSPQPSALSPQPSALNPQPSTSAQQLIEVIVVVTCNCAQSRTQSLENHQRRPFLAHLITAEPSPFEQVPCTAHTTLHHKPFELVQKNRTVGRERVGNA